MNRFVREVLLERARLALDDPIGEFDAVNPTTRTAAIRTIRELTEPIPAPRPHARRDHHGDAALRDALGIRTGPSAGC